jgi:hypothetical protein
VRNVTYWHRETISSGLGMIEMRSVGVLHCVLECRVIVYCALTGASLNSLKLLAICIHRYAEYIQFVPAGTLNMYFCIYRALSANFLKKHNLYPLFHYCTFLPLQ